MKHYLLLLSLPLLLLACNSKTASQPETEAPQSLQITHSEAIQKNSKDYPKPLEDYLIADPENQIYIVLDGVSRDKIDGVYPNPSPAAAVAKIFGEEVKKALLAEQIPTTPDARLTSAIRTGNQAVANYNAQSDDWDFLPGVVGIVTLIQDDTFYYAYNGDCYGRLIRDGSIQPLTTPQTQAIHDHKGEFTADQVRNEICNNKSHPYSYGVYTGQPEAMDFVETGSFALTPGDRIVLSSDGMENLFADSSFSLLEVVPAAEMVQRAVTLEAGDAGLGTDDKAVVVLEVGR